MDATLLLRGAWVGVGWDVNVHLHLHTTWMLRCCYVGHGLGWDWIYSWMWRRNCKGDVWAAMPTLFHWDRDCCKPAAKTCSAANGGVTLFLQCFQCSGIQKPCKILLCTMFFFFIFGRFSIAGKLPKWPKIPFQHPLALRHPKILEKCRKHHRILVSVRNRFWPPPAKADIATAILTNVIEHLVLLFCPPISTPSPPKRCGRIFS